MIVTIDLTEAQLTELLAGLLLISEIASEFDAQKARTFRDLRTRIIDKALANHPGNGFAEYLARLRAKILEAP